MILNNGKLISASNPIPVQIVSIDSRARDARDFGAISDEDKAGFDSYSALQTAIDTCSDEGVELYIPKGTYNISQPLISTKSRFFIRGAADGTVIKATGDFNILRLGPGDVGSGLVPSGYITSITLKGATAAPVVNNVGLFLDGLRHFKVDEVFCDNVTVGFDLINNCYGTKFYGCRTVFGGTRVGLVLRGAENGGTTWGSGSDIPFYDCWFHGVDGGVWIHPDGTGYHFYGGQVTGGSTRTADADLFGSIVIGKNYYTQAVGTVGTVDFNGIDFEGAQRVWQIRAFGRANVAFRSCAILSTNATHKALGVLKIDGAENGQWKFSDNNIDGGYSGASLVVHAGHGSVFSIREEGTLFGFSCTANAVAVTSGATLTSQSNLNVGVSQGRVGSNPFLGVGRGRWKWNDTTGKFESAPAHGAGTFIPMVNQVAVPATATSAGQVGDYASDATHLYTCHATNTWKRVAIATW